MPLPRFHKLDEQRQADILEAAAREFADHGFQNASYNRIIERSPISKGAMYYYFADKDDLYRTVLSVAFAEWFTHVGFDVRADDAATFWAACEELYRRSLHFMLNDPTSAALCMRVAQSRGREALHPVVAELDVQVRGAVDSIVSRGQKLGAVRDDLPSDLLVHVTRAMFDAGDLWLADHWRELSEEDVPRVAGMLLDLSRRLAEPRS